MWAGRKGEARGRGPWAREAVERECVAGDVRARAERGWHPRRFEGSAPPRGAPAAPRSQFPKANWDTEGPSRASGGGRRGHQVPATGHDPGWARSGPELRIMRILRHDSGFRCPPSGRGFFCPRLAPYARCGEPIARYPTSPRMVGQEKARFWTRQSSIHPAGRMAHHRAKYL